jgi:hypothetical protein
VPAVEPKADPGQRWVLIANLVTRLVGGQTFILMPDSTMHILENDSAVLLFNLLQSSAETGQSVAELSAALHSSFDVSADRASEDVNKFVRDLHVLGILDVRPQE